MDYIFWCSIWAIGLFSNHLVQATDGSPTSVTVQCLHESSKKCTVPIVNLTASSDELVLPNLAEKTTLQIKGGKLTAFDGKLCDQLGTVRKLQFGQLELGQLCLAPQLREVSAAGNNIETVTFKSGSSQYKLELLDLRSNGLKTLEGFHVLVNLVEVHLENNALESFDWGVFEKMSKLEKLYLNGNNLKEVTANVEIKLPFLEYLSLASNQLATLDVTKWEFESLTEYDLSSNKLMLVEDLSHKFPSAQGVLLANNQWYCKWLQDTLENFNKTFVTIKDRDEHCEGITSANICCTPESDIIPEDTELQSKLAKLEEDQKAMRSNLETKFVNLKIKNDNELADLENKLMLLVPSAPTTVDTGKNPKYAYFEQQLQEVQSTAEKELKQVSLQQRENETALLRVSYTILELKKSVEKGRKAVAGLQAQFDNLRSDIYKKVKNRD